MIVHNRSEVEYWRIVEWVRWIDGELSRGTMHFRNKAGELLTTLDEVVRAILDDELDEADDQN